MNIGKGGGIPSSINALEICGVAAQGYFKPA
jgi:hypothetical protein